MKNSSHTSLAETLWLARLNGATCPALTDLAPELTIEDAYLISQHNAQKSIQINGDQIIGKKVGLTSLAVQKQLGVNEPDFGYLFASMAVENGGTLSPRNLLQGRIEGEVAFTLKHDLNGPNVTTQDVIDATAFIQPCIEIIDSRIADWKIKIQDTISDNASSAFFVLGDKQIPLSDLANHLPQCWMKLYVNNELKSEGTGQACLESPIKAVAWLANKMIQLGEPLKAGDLILSGAFGPVVPVNVGDVCHVEIENLGTVSFTV